MCSQLVQFTLACKGYDNHHCHNKYQTGNRAGVWMTSCPEEIENLEDFEKDSVESDHGVEKLSSDHTVEKLRLDHEICRSLGCC